MQEMDPSSLKGYNLCQNTNQTVTVGSDSTDR